MSDDRTDNSPMQDEGAEREYEAPQPSATGAVEPASEVLGFGSAPAMNVTDAGHAVTRYSNKQVRRARDVLTKLYAVRRAARFYPVEHPAVVEGLESLLESTGIYHDDGVDVTFAFFEGEILLGEQLLTEESVLFDQLVRDMTSAGIGTLSFERGLTVEELQRAIPIIAADAAVIDQAGGIEAAVAAADITHMSFGAVRVLERVSQVGGGAQEAQASYTGAVSLVREIDRLLKANRHVSTHKVKGVVRSLVDNALTNRYAMLQLTGLKNYDEYTFFHSANVAILSLALGSTITNDYRFLSSLGVGALLHDIGKLTVDLEILNKPGALTPEEWAGVRQHPVNGAEMTSLLPGVDKSAIVTILEHHMRFDSTGYPLRTPPKKQHLASRIVAVADSYDAMTSRRSYSAARVQDEAMVLLAKSAGSSLDPTLVRLFIRLMGVYPPRSVVRLSNGDVGIVLNPSETDPLRPFVRVIAHSDGTMVEPSDVDTALAQGISVKGCIDPQLLNIEVEDYL